MEQPFEITSNDIEQLDDQELTELLRCLLLQEVAVLGLPRVHVDVSLKINIPDGGQDGRLEWTDGPNPSQSNWIPSRLNVFQVKATDLGPAGCGREVETRDQTALKPRVKEAVDGGGAYILFTGRHCEGTMVSERVDHIKEAFKKHEGQIKADSTIIEVYGAEKIATWTNEHAAAVTFVMHKRGRAIPASMQRWEEWDAEHHSHLAFQVDAPRAAIIQSVRESLSQPKAVARIAGLSGLGKSRLALEVFRPHADLEQSVDEWCLHTACVYISDGARFGNEVIKTMRAMVGAKIQGCIVVDECPMELHRDLERIVVSSPSSLRLLTLDFEPDSNPKSSRCTFYRLEAISQSDMEDLLKKSQSGLPDEHISNVAAVAQGYPRMADLLIDAIISGEPKLWDMAPIDVFKKIVIRRSVNPEKVWNVAQALSALEHLGVYGDAAYQIDPFTKHFCTDINSDAVYAAIRDLENAGIAYRRGDYVRITPLPLAVALAAQWWNICAEERATAILTGGAVPPEMVDATTNQLMRLSGHEWVSSLVARIYGPTSPFRRRDRLDSASGSRLAHSLAEVNPEAVCAAVHSAFGMLTVDEAREIRRGRRQLVWCLEKLTWWSSTFDDSAWVLLLFAAGENETWGNNATNQFKQLYHLYLAGTEVPALERLEVIGRGIQSGDNAMTAICVEALCEAFTADHFSRFSEPVTSSGRLTRSEWQPHTDDDVLQYWQEALRLLDSYLARADDLGLKARTELASKARGIIRANGLAILESAVTTVLGSDVAEWPEILDSLRESLIYDGADYPHEYKERIQNLIALCQPTDIEARLRFVVAKPSWHELESDEFGNIIVVAEERARHLAREFAADPGSLLPHLNTILIDEQRQGYTFGYELGVHIEDPFSFLEKSIQHLLSIPTEIRNPNVLLGLSAATGTRNRDRLREYLHQLILDDRSQPLALALIRAMGVDDTDIGLLISLLLTHKIDPAALHAFAFGGALESATDRSVAELSQACINYEADGPFVAFEILSMRSIRSSISPDLFEVAKQALIHPFVLTSLSSSISCHAFERLAKIVIVDTKIDLKFVADLTNWLVTATDIGIDLRNTIHNVLVELLKTHIDVAWPTLCNALHGLANEPLREYKAMSILRNPLDDSFDIVGLVGEERLLEWGAMRSEVPTFIARLIRPLREAQEGADFPSWTDFAINFLHKYGSDLNVLSALYANIQTGGWIGSMVPMLTRRVRAFRELARHPNPDVVRWAATAVDALEAEIARERKRDEEAEFGIR